MSNSTFPVGSRAVLHNAPGNLSRYQNQECEIREVFSVKEIYGVEFSDGHIAYAPFCYFRPVNPAKTPRRSPLTLKPDADTRSEAQRMDEGIRFLEKCGYLVLRVGQGKVPAVCHKCSRENKRLTQIRCRVCNSQGFSPSTNSTKGTPDSFVSHVLWPDGLFMGLEWKDGPQGQRTTEQKELEADGRIFVAWNLETCLSAVAEFERDVVGRQPHRGIVAYLSSKGGQLV